MKLLALFPILILLAQFQGKAEEFSFESVSDLSGKKFDPFASPAPTVVLIFVGVECPISNKQAPEVNRLQRKHSGEKVQFWLIYPDGKTTAKEISKHLKAYAYSSPALRDPKHELVRIAGVKVTPETAVFHKKELIYRGRIDDRHPALGVTRKEATSHDLDRVLEALAAGQKISFTSTLAIGCYIEAGSQK